MLAYIQSIGAATTGGAKTTIAATLASNTTANATIVAVLTSKATTARTPTITDTQGRTWTLAHSATGATSGTGAYYVYYSSNGGTAAAETVTATVPSDNWSLVLYEVSGFTSGVAVDVKKAATSSGTNNPTVSTGTLIRTEELIIAAAGNTSAGTYTAGAGFTNMVTTATGGTGTQLSAASEIQITSATTALTAQFTQSLAAGWGIIAVGLYDNAQPAENLSDSFTGTVIDTTKWSTSVVGTGSITQNDQITASWAGGSSSYFNLSTKRNYRLAGSYFSFKFQAFNITTFLSLTPGSGLSLELGVGSVRLMNGGTAVITYTYTAAPLYVKLREASGTLYLDTSTDGTTYTNRGSAVTSTYGVNYSTQNIQPSFNGSRNMTDGSIVIDDVNRSVAMASTLKDNFNDNAISASWSVEAATNSVFETNQRIEITHSTGTEYNTLVTSAPYNLIGSSVHAQVVNAGNQALASHEAILGARLDGSNTTWMSASNGNLAAWRRVGGTQTIIGTAITYNATTHKWWRIRESGGTVFYDTSADGETWTNRWSLANPFSLVAVYPYLQSGAWQAEASSSLAYFDNFNVGQFAGASTYSGDSNLTAAGLKIATGGATTSGDSNTTAAGTVKKIASATISGDANATAAGNIQPGGGALLVAGSETSATGTLQIGGAATISSDSNIVAYGEAEYFDDSAFAGESNMIVEAKRVQLSGATIDSGSNLTADGIHVQAAQPQLGAGSETGVVIDPQVHYSNVQKRLVYRIYKSNGTFLRTWVQKKDVTSTPSIKEQINQAGSEVTLTVARRADDFGEGADIDYGNRVEIWVADRDTPNGLRLFVGKITKYHPNYMEETVQVVLLGYGSELSQYILETGMSEGQSFTTTSGERGFGQGQNALSIEHAITTPATGFKLPQLIYRLRGGHYVTATDPKSGTETAGFDIVGQTVTATVYASEANLRAGTSPLGAASVTIANITMQDYVFTFGTPLDLAGATTYYVGITTSTVYSGATEPPSTYIATGTGDTTAVTIRNQVNNGGWTTLTDDAYYIMMQSTGSTTAPYLSVDPSDIAKSVIDDLASRGCHVIYTAESIDMTGTVVSYTFNTNTGQEAIDKVLELCPINWYYYIDQRTFPAVFHLHEKGSQPDHVFKIGHDVTKLDIEKSMEPIKNVIYFTGKDLYKRYALQSSIDKYGIRAMKMSDQRVTQETTADIIANRSLVGTPQILVNLSVGDNGLEANKGYDIEAPTLGQMVKIANTGNSASSQYDAAIFDTSPYDYDLTNIGTIQFQITEKTYTLEEIAMSLSTTPPDVSKRIADIKRNVDDITYGSNPAMPTS